MAMVVETSSAEARGRERRRWVRHPGTRIRAYVMADALATPWQVRVLNVSAGGIGVVADRPLEADSLLTLRLDQPTAGFSCLVETRLVYVIPKPDGTLVVGGEFRRELTDEELRELL
jgi:hypothetical protein